MSSTFLDPFQALDSIVWKWSWVARISIIISVLLSLKFAYTKWKVVSPLFVHALLHLSFLMIFFGYKRFNMWVVIKDKKIIFRFIIVFLINNPNQVYLSQTHFYFYHLSLMFPRSIIFFSSYLNLAFMTLRHKW